MSSPGLHASLSALQEFKQCLIWEAWGESVRLELIRRVELYRACNANLKLQRALYQVCARDFYFWAENFLWTHDPRSLGLKHFPVIIFPKQREYIDALLDDEITSLLVEKSRDMGASVLLCAVVLWRWLFQQGQAFGLITRVGKDLDDGTFSGLFGKIDYMLENLPSWMIDKNDFTRRHSPAPLFSNKRNGNSIIGGATTNDTFRGGRFSMVAVDEAALIQDLSTILKAIQGTTEKTVVLSSVNGESNDFAHIRFGRYGWQSAPLGAPDVEPGVWRHMALHYRSDPRKTEIWIKRKKAGMLAEAWNAEYEINYKGSTRWQVLPEFDAQRHIFTAEVWNGFYDNLIKTAQLVEAWDFGQGASLTVSTWFGYISALDRLYVIDYRSWRSQAVETVAYDVGAAGWYTTRTSYHRKPQARIGDQYGKSRDSNQTSWIDNLAAEGIEIKAVCAKNFTFNNQLIRRKMKEGKIFLGPECDRRHNPNLPSLAESFAGYTYKVSGTGDSEHGSEPDKHSIHSHIYDTLVYAALHIWERDAFEEFDTERTLPHSMRNKQKPNPYIR